MEELVLGRRVTSSDFPRQPATSIPAQDDSSSSSPKSISVLFVCLGNICRSPMAEAVFAHLTEDHPLISRTDSAGTAAFHVGSRPDSRTMQTLKNNKITGYKHAARQVSVADFCTFSYILAMDSENLANLKTLRSKAVKKNGGDEDGIAKTALFGDYGGEVGEEVIDPYYGEDDGFATCYEQMSRFTKGFLERIEKDKADGKL